MRVTSHPAARLLGYVEVKVASQVFKLPVQAVPAELGEGSQPKTGFSSEGTDGFAILVDAAASEREQQDAIA
ncbi:MAG: hypothetical protein ACRELB_08010, partial [Polyangiaceae bacterium]